ncbi:hypothetical protein HHK36_013072 [Tetracentron sinense]|uniref:Pentatricopeptide repeat-containing protein n=1 Tax=Tetracentron sinense TaxID=13715 RepID=A0A834ZA23_TETSI|nr:hypothetical protein HHK36_013072 [Tetracentron sinense]
MGSYLFCLRTPKVGILNLNLVSEPKVNAVADFDLLIHVCCTQFKNLGLGFSSDVFRFLTNRGLFPSLKTCNFLLNSLVKANELERTYDVFGRMRRGGSRDAAINALCKGGKVEDANEVLHRRLIDTVYSSLDFYWSYVNQQEVTVFDHFRSFLGVSKVAFKAPSITPTISRYLLL